MKILYNYNMKVFIPGNVPSSKNSKQWTGKFLVSSKTCQKYIKQSKQDYIKHAEEFRKLYDSLPKPVNIIFQFIRSSKRQFDYINPAQTVQDLMVQYHWIDDDNADCIVPVFLPYAYNKENPGVYIILQRLN